MIGFSIWVWPNPAGGSQPAAFQPSFNFSDIRNSGLAALITGIA